MTEGELDAMMDEIEHPKDVEDAVADLEEGLEPLHEMDEEDLSAEDLEGALTVHVVEGDGAAGYVAAREVTNILSAAQGDDGLASLALTGGSTPRGLYRWLTDDEFRDRVDWGRVEIFWGDERAVPLDSPDANYRLAVDTLLDPENGVGAPLSRVHRIEGELGAETAATRYADELTAALGDTPRFDLVILGLGADGHVASLFPEDEVDDPAGWDTEEQRLVVAARAPEGMPGSERVTLTLPVLNAARHVMFLVTGEGKAEAVARVLGGDETRPGTHVQPSAVGGGSTLWILDEAAASGLMRAVDEVDEMDEDDWEDGEGSSS